VYLNHAPIFGNSPTIFLWGKKKTPSSLDAVPSSSSQRSCYKSGHGNQTTHRIGILIKKMEGYWNLAHPKNRMLQSMTLEWS
jgi:hypothetical protein